MPDTAFELQAANAFAGWQVLEAGVRGTNSLDDKRIADWLRKNRVDTIVGRLRFDGPNNYGDDANRIKQVQNKSWVVVHPREFALPGAKLQG